MTYAVVEFTEDRSVAIVSYNWIIDDVCFWPPYPTGRLTAAVKKAEEPQENWQQYRVRVLHLYESYDAARAKLSKAEDTSALETDIDDGHMVRKRKKKSLSDDDDIQVQAELPIAQVDVVVDNERQRKKAPAKKSRETSKNLTSLPSVPASLQEHSPVALNGHPVSGGVRKSPRKHIQNSSTSTCSGCTTEGKDPSETEPVGPSPVHRVSPSVSPSNSPSFPAAASSKSQTIQSRQLSYCDLNASATPGNGQLWDDGPSSASSAGSARRRLANSQSSSSSMTTGGQSSDLKLVLSKLASIEALQRQHNQVLQHCLAALERSDMDENCEPPEGVDLPLKTLRELRDLEACLEDETKRKQLARYLGAVGGKDVPETTRRVMRTMMTNALAVKMNFIGRGEKTGIADLKILKVIIMAVKQNKLLKSATRAEIEMTVKLWLRYASDRSGGRLQRLKLQAKKKITPDKSANIGDVGDVETESD